MSVPGPVSSLLTLSPTTRCGCHCHSVRSMLHWASSAATKHQFRQSPYSGAIRCVPWVFCCSKTTGSKISGSMSELSSPVTESDAAASTVEDVLVQYVVLRRDLIDTWPLGSVVTQGCHASVAAVWSNRDDPHTLDYCSPDNLDSMHKVTLEVKGEAQILNLSEKLKASGIVHKLWIEQPENFPTCLATKPYPKSAVSSFFRKLKLCK